MVHLRNCENAKCKNVKPGMVVIALLIAVVGAESHARFSADLETGAVFSGYNDVRIPGDTGTLFSLSEELETKTSAFFRLKLGYAITPKHSLSLLIAPLRLSGEGQISRDVWFENQLFQANSPLESRYRFDSYRLGYRYHLLNASKVDLGLGITAKIRDASIRLESDSRTAEKNNTGFVPLLNFTVRWKPVKSLHLVVDGDALAGPQGRAEDVLLAIQWRPSNVTGFKCGYRLLEGGADVDEVYNFTLINYLVIGATLYF